jgi:hypothetical protein
MAAVELCALVVALFALVFALVGLRVVRNAAALAWEVSGLGPRSFEGCRNLGSVGVFCAGVGGGWVAVVAVGVATVVLFSPGGTAGTDSGGAGASAEAWLVPTGV